MDRRAANLEIAYREAVERYGEYGVDVEQALLEMQKFAISMHCWQGDDVRGFESGDRALDGGLAVTGKHPGRARNADELREDLNTALGLIPGKHRVNLHAIYAEGSGREVSRDNIGPEHFQSWIQWAREKGLGLDFNPTFFAHPMAEDGFTLSHASREVRDFWVAHGIACRKIGEAIGKSLGTPCVTNIWIPDGMKDTPADRRGPRERLMQSLDRIFEESVDSQWNRDAVEGKLFGIGAESYTVGSHEFYLGYAMRRGILLCLDLGHYHPTESVADKLSAVLLYLDRVLLHVSRGVRWDSDHVVTLGDELSLLATEIVQGGYAQRVHIGLDYFDASINRVAAWVIGMRATQKALLYALVEPSALLREAERKGDYTTRLALREEFKTLPFGVVWDVYCFRAGVPIGAAWLGDVQRYASEVMSYRG